MIICVKHWFKKWWGPNRCSRNIISSAFVLKSVICFFRYPAATNNIIIVWSIGILFTIIFNNRSKLRSLYFFIVFTLKMVCDFFPIFKNCLESWSFRRSKPCTFRKQNALSAMVQGRSWSCLPNQPVVFCRRKCFLDGLSVWFLVGKSPYAGN